MFLIRLYSPSLKSHKNTPAFLSLSPCRPSAALSSPLLKGQRRARKTLFSLHLLFLHLSSLATPPARKLTYRELPEGRRPEKKAKSSPCLRLGWREREETETVQILRLLPISDRFAVRDMAEAQGPDGGYLLEMEELSLIVDQGRPPLQKALSRKSSQRVDRAAAADDVAATTTGGPAFPAAAAAAEEMTSGKFVVVELPSGAAAAGAAAALLSVSPGQGRRSHVRRAASPWFHPRNVLVFFATLSSAGTILLLYFTLSMGRMGDGNTDSS